MKINSVKAVVAGGYTDKEGNFQMIGLIGAFDSFAEAYGEAYLYLSGMASDYDESDGLYITTPAALEGDTGYELALNNKDGKPEYCAMVLFNDGKEDAE